MWEPTSYSVTTDHGFGGRTRETKTKTRHGASDKSCSVGHTRKFLDLEKTVKDKNWGTQRSSVNFHLEFRTGPGGTHTG